MSTRISIAWADGFHLFRDEGELYLEVEGDRFDVLLRVPEAAWEAIREAARREESQP